MDMDVKYFVRHMDKSGSTAKEVFYTLEDANERFEEIVKTDPTFADLDIQTTVNARSIE